MFEKILEHKNTRSIVKYLFMRSMISLSMLTYTKDFVKRPFVFQKKKRLCHSISF